jgi:hypothetical protein
VLQFSTVDEWFDWRAKQPEEYTGYVNCWFCCTRPHRWVEGHDCDNVCGEYWRGVNIADRLGLLGHLPSEERDELLTPLHVMEEMLNAAIEAGEMPGLRIAKVSP